MYLTIMKDVPESNRAKTDYEYLKILKHKFGSDEIKQIKLINIFRQIFKVPIICGAFYDIFFRIVILALSQNFPYTGAPLYYLRILTILKILMIIIRWIHKKAILCTYKSIGKVYIKN
ncbi:hypothetical protein C2G38_543489 [Gigaspora rosea]|uniref:Uncharacterized protein n=1 Tax=Gigaspora rosea TaxID=44941 RepID=A0A397UBB7_9GLOM|nr:hypothetical protein C2G38_543489 [Gigaspora rosea]